MIKFYWYNNTLILETEKRLVAIYELDDGLTHAGKKLLHDYAIKTFWTDSENLKEFRRELVWYCNNFIKIKNDKELKKYFDGCRFDLWSDQVFKFKIRFKNKHYAYVHDPDLNERKGVITYNNKTNTYVYIDSRGEKEAEHSNLKTLINRMNLKLYKWYTI